MAAVRLLVGGDSEPAHEGLLQSDKDDCRWNGSDDGSHHERPVRESAVNVEQRCQPNLYHLG